MEAPRSGTPRESQAALRHELSDVNVRRVFYFAFWLTLAAILIHVAVWLLYENLAARARPLAGIPREPAAGRPTVAQPQLQTEPASELSELRAREEKILGRYGWIDREKGIVRIPIERAMEIIAQEGLPVAKQTGGGTEAAKKNPREGPQNK